MSYDAAGNLINDGVHSYTYDAEGNLLQVDGGATATYQYSALNQRVRIDEGGVSAGFIYNQSGQRVSVWDVNSGAQMQGETYWGQEPVEYNYAGQATYFHGDWLGTGRGYTDYQGNDVLSVNSLPFGDGSQFGTVGYSPWTFAYVDEDYYSMADSGTAHAQYRQYGDGQGRWFSPDPYSGSYDPSNPQSMNRYSYVMNNPLTFTDPSGQLFGLGSIGIGAICGPECAGIVAGLGAIFDLYELLSSHPSFHGSLKPRPSASDPAGFGENLGLPAGMPQGNWGLGLALNLPQEGCEFGACSPVGNNVFGADDAVEAGICVAQPEVCAVVAIGAATVYAYEIWGKNIRLRINVPDGTNQNLMPEDPNTCLELLNSQLESCKQNSKNELGYWACTQKAHLQYLRCRSGLPPL